MATAHADPSEQSWFSRVLNTDFCPWANRFVYWLKEPIGWFVIATAASVLVGMYANPVGWTIAGALTCIMVVGMIWPLIAVWATRCDLRPEVDAVHEGDACRMIFAVRNRLPLPMWGLAIEGYLDCEGDESSPVVALSHVPPICVADYAIQVRPELRGHFPIQTPKVCCSFPFGIWTARRELVSVESLTVWPRVYEVAGVCPLNGHVNSEQGDGQRGGRSGDFVGVRDFRRGDSPRHINWAQSARTDTLIVTERGGPQCVEIDVDVDPSLRGNQTRESLAVRMRVAASILCNLHATRVPVQASVGDRSLRPSPTSRGRRQLLDLLTEVPADGCPRQASRADVRRVRIEISGEASGTDVLVTVIDSNPASRSAGGVRLVNVDASRSLDDQLIGFWEALGYAHSAA